MTDRTWILPKLMAAVVLMHVSCFGTGCTAREWRFHTLDHELAAIDARFAFPPFGASGGDIALEVEGVRFPLERGCELSPVASGEYLRAQLDPGLEACMSECERLANESFGGGLPRETPCWWWSHARWGPYSEWNQFSLRHPQPGGPRCLRFVILHPYCAEQFDVPSRIKGIAKDELGGVYIIGQ